MFIGGELKNESHVGAFLFSFFGFRFSFFVFRFFFASFFLVQSGVEILSPQTQLSGYKHGAGCICFVRMVMREK